MCETDASVSFRVGTYCNLSCFDPLRSKPTRKASEKDILAVAADERLLVLNQRLDARRRGGDRLQIVGTVIKEAAPILDYTRAVRSVATDACVRCLCEFRGASRVLPRFARKLP